MLPPTVLITFTYHARNESCEIQDMKLNVRVLESYLSQNDFPSSPFLPQILEFVSLNLIKGIWKLQTNSEMELP